MEGLLIKILFYIIATEAATNLIVKSEFSIRFIKKPLFNWRRFKVCSFIHDILDCGYCTSVWSALILSLFFVTNKLDLLIIILVLHRMSNLLHFIIDWFDLKRPRDFEFNSKGEEDYERLREEHDSFMGTHNETIGGSRSNNTTG